jgi:hypothetical protein
MPLTIPDMIVMAIAVLVGIAFVIHWPDDE